MRRMFPTACRSLKTWREERLGTIAQARAKIEAGAKERYERELAEHPAKLAARVAKTASTGRRSGGKPPEPPTAGALPKDRINLTDEDSRIMPVASGGFDQGSNAQAAVAAGSLRWWWRMGFRRRSIRRRSRRWRIG
jgi:hypothetical protein